MAACSTYGPGLASIRASARSSAAKPQRISSWSQRTRFLVGQQDLYAYNRRSPQFHAAV